MTEPRRFVDDHLGCLLAGLLRHYPATQMSSFVFLTPVFALLFGVGLLGEPLALQLVLVLALAALAGVAVGIVLVSRRS